MRMVRYLIIAVVFALLFAGSFGVGAGAGDEGRQEVTYVGSTHKVDPGVIELCEELVGRCPQQFPEGFVVSWCDEDVGIGGVVFCGVPPGTITLRMEDELTEVPEALVRCYVAFGDWFYLPFAYLEGSITVEIPDWCDFPARIQLANTMGTVTTGTAYLEVE